MGPQAAEWARKRASALFGSVESYSYPPPPVVISPPLQSPPPLAGNGQLAQKALKIPGANRNFYKAPKLICTVIPPPPFLYKLRPCPSYSRRRDRIDLVPSLVQYKCSAAT